MSNESDGRQQNTPSVGQMGVVGPFVGHGDGHMEAILHVTFFRVSGHLGHRTCTHGCTKNPDTHAHSTWGAKVYLATATDCYIFERLGLPSVKSMSVMAIHDTKILRGISSRPMIPAFTALLQRRRS